MNVIHDCINYSGTKFQIVDPETRKIIASTHTLHAALLTRDNLVKTCAHDWNGAPIQHPLDNIDAERASIYENIYHDRGRWNIDIRQQVTTRTEATRRRDAFLEQLGSEAVTVEPPTATTTGETPRLKIRYRKTCETLDEAIETRNTYYHALRKIIPGDYGKALT